MVNEDIIFDVRSIPTEGLLDDFVSNDSESLVHRKYNEGRPNGSLDATEKGSKESLSRMLGFREPEVFFGSHIRETIHQLKILFK